MKRCNAVILFFLLFGAASVSAATFTHPDAGYTVWYPDGWYVHKEPAIVEPVATPAELWNAGARVVLERRSPEHATGIFVASSIPPDQYVGGKQILPEGAAELAVWREKEKQACETLVAGILRRVAWGSLDSPRSIPQTGGDVLVHSFVSQPYAPWPVFYALACKELAGVPFVIRLVAAGPDADREQVFRIIARAHGSLKALGSK